MYFSTASLRAAAFLAYVAFWESERAAHFVATALENPLKPSAAYSSLLSQVNSPNPVAPLTASRAFWRASAFFCAVAFSVARASGDLLGEGSGPLFEGQLGDGLVVLSSEQREGIGSADFGLAPRLVEEGPAGGGRDCLCGHCLFSANIREAQHSL